jgi:hypothetical protein
MYVCFQGQQKEEKMRLLWVIGLILLVLWLLGLITANTLGGGVHVLLVIGIILVIVWLVSGRK